ncbi:SUMF1/EgtB/PvdO family nonheme iron enzyme [Acinetobacter sp. NIPH 2699]|uniref:SUMF1/EgtB/PvdO family nonheme iron enzyme n=1 Tax=Acinetobacter sp. NIPH 2699 TaxID=2923433 RepID=UPI001F4A9392|nr:SUMF1/EgtB/PvdO family nonheme iron enzyme [Acinetobacter sp. NIPH 2699]MCH7336934.1 formylglycine-generating enzyme family protein [Acinetobacter sp. NIPH 2699]
MKLNCFLTVLCSLSMTGCSKVKPDSSHSQNDVATSLAQLGSLQQCQQYSGLPDQWQQNQTAGMVWIPKGTFQLGSNQAYPDELNFGQKERQVNGFWIDQTEVTVAQFSSFVKATGYITDAEKQKQAAVFLPDTNTPNQWWQLKADYTWKTPNGTAGDSPNPAEAVRYISKNDAEHYAIWLGRDLPTEQEWEYAAKAGSTTDTPLHQAPQDAHQHPQANYWQGDFPFKNTTEDHFEGVAPVGCYPANAFKLFDMIGNVWEWTSSVYQGAHDQHMGNYADLRQHSIASTQYVIKGGSFLCASNYCSRYRNSSRYPQEFDLVATHVGFRTVLRTP